MANGQRDMVQIRGKGGQRGRPDITVGRSQFDRSHGLKMTFDARYLYPILVDEVLPGDTFTLKTEGFCRIFSPLDAPVMDNIELETCYFFVPTRLVWTRWPDMHGEHDGAGAQDTDYTVPIFDTGLTVDHDNTGVAVANLAAYMGLPDGLQSAQVNVNCLPFRCYKMIYRDWFRDQNVIAPQTVDVDDGPDTPGNYAIHKSAKKHDYFTSALPYLQKGDIEYLPMTGTVNVYTDAGDTDDISVWSTDMAGFRKMDIATGTHVQMDGTAGTDQFYVDLSTLTSAGISINALRESVAIQRLLERDARGGTRYVEYIKAHFGVTSPDYRLQRPEYLGGGKSYVNISPVANTSATATEDQGELRGIGTGRVTGGFAKSFTEHGYIIGLIRARGDITYFQGLDRLWSRSTRYDFYVPALANLGEQSILNKELYVSNSSATDNAVFGYQERWAEYREKRSRVVGLFNPDVSGALSHWHLAEDFASLPTLGQTFIEDQTPMDRVTTVDTEHDFIADIWFNLKCARPLPVYSIPALMGARF